jgi:hypothetical protein
MRPSRPNYNNSWRDRERAKEVARVEEEKRKADEARMRAIAPTETNFPTFATGGGVSAKPSTNLDKNFAALAQTWNQADEQEKRMKAVQSAPVQNEFNHVFVYRPARPVYEEEEYPEEPICIIPPKVDEDGWQEVKKKARKGPKIMTQAELEWAAAHPLDSGSDGDEGGFNDGLYESNPHDHR